VGVRAGSKLDENEAALKRFARVAAAALSKVG